MTDLTPETLAEDVRRHFSSARDGSINARLRDRILDSLAAEKAAREEAEAKGDVNFTSAANTGYAFGVERDEWREKYEGARANMERLHQRVREAEARADKAEQELKAERARNRLIVMPSDPESKAQMEQLLAHLTGENRRALDAAEARVAALEAELAGWRGNPMAQKYAALVAGINALADQWEANGITCDCGHTLGQHNGLGCYATVSYRPRVRCTCSLTDDRCDEDIAVPALRALIEKGADLAAMTRQRDEAITDCVEWERQRDNWHQIAKRVERELADLRGEYDRYRSEARGHAAAMDEAVAYAKSAFLIEREAHAALRTRIEALADKWDHGVGDKALLGRRKSMRALRAALSPTDPTKEGDRD